MASFRKAIQHLLPPPPPSSDDNNHVSSSNNNATSFVFRPKRHGDALLQCFQHMMQWSHQTLMEYPWPVDIQQSLEFDAQISMDTFLTMCRLLAIAVHIVFRSGVMYSVSSEDMIGSWYIVEDATREGRYIATRDAPSYPVLSVTNWRQPFKHMTSYKKEELVQMCATWQLSTDGTKEQLYERIMWRYQNINQTYESVLGKRRAH